MKAIRSLFIIAIGMMVLTVTANTTAKLEQKQKAELVFKANDVSVVNEIKVVSIVMDAKTKSNKTQALRSVNEPESLNAIIKDVGWQNLKENATNESNKKNILILAKKEIVYLTHKGSILIKRKNC